MHTYHKVTCKPVITFSNKTNSPISKGQTKNTKLNRIYSTQSKVEVTALPVCLRLAASWSSTLLTLRQVCGLRLRGIC